MKTTTKTLALALLASLAASGCTATMDDGLAGGGKDPVEGDAYLSIVGERNIFMENGWQQAIKVRYHDANNEPLAGQIEFSILGDAAGSTLSTTIKTTNAQGEAEVFVTATTAGEVLFDVEALAVYADPVNWTVSVFGDTPQLPMDPTGRYNMDNQFDIVSGLPGTVGTVVNAFIDMTDGPYDPATWLIDLALDKADLPGLVESAINAARPFLDGYLNDVIKSYAPGVVTKLLQIGDKFGQVTRKFGTMSTLDVQPMGAVESNEYVATHTMTHVKFKIDSQEYVFTMAELGMQPIVIPNVSFTMDNETRALIGQHEAPVSYGALLALAVEEVIIPLVDPYSSNLSELMLNYIDCYAVGYYAYNYLAVPFTSPGLFETACIKGVQFGANFIMNKIRDIDATAAKLQIGGEARPQDTNADRKVDILSAGKWNGAMLYGSTPATLGVSTFRGDKTPLN